MYLLELGDNGLVKEDLSGSGWKAINSFRALVDKHGLQALTVVALTRDYLTVFRNYPDYEERFKRSCDHIYDSRKKLKYDDKLVVAAMEDYADLQWHAEIEQEEIYNQIKSRYLKALAEANKKEDDSEIERVNKHLNRHEQAVANFRKHFKKDEIVKANSVTEGNYHLSRIEQDIKTNDKKSRFNTMGKNLENPDELNINK